MLWKMERGLLVDETYTAAAGSRLYWIERKSTKLPSARGKRGTPCMSSRFLSARANSSSKSFFSFGTLVIFQTPFSFFFSRALKNAGVMLFVGTDLYLSIAIMTWLGTITTASFACVNVSRTTRLVSSDVFWNWVVILSR